MARAVFGLRTHHRERCDVAAALERRDHWGRVVQRDTKPEVGIAGRDHEGCRARDRSGQLIEGNALHERQPRDVRYVGRQVDHAETGGAGCSGARSAGFSDHVEYCARNAADRAADCQLAGCDLGDDGDAQIRRSGIDARGAGLARGELEITAYIGGPAYSVETRPVELGEQLAFCAQT
jgi:hypothetical protein